MSRVMIINAFTAKYFTEYYECHELWLLTRLLQNLDEVEILCLRIFADKI